MSMNVKAFDSALDFVPANESSGKNGIWGMIVASFDAISEGIRLASDYKTLTARGVAPDIAVRAVFEQIKR